MGIGKPIKHEWGLERDFHGFRQVKYTSSKSPREWIFYISGFSGPPLSDGSDSIGHVLLFSGGTEACLMDEKARVRVRGIWYGHERWEH